MGKGKSSKPKGNGRPAADKKPPGCYVLSLKVRNVRCFGNKEQELKCCDEQGRPRQWTVILGDNGGGKTTLLQSMVLQSDAKNFGEVNSDTDASWMTTIFLDVIYSLCRSQDAFANSQLEWTTVNWRSPSRTAVPRFKSLGWEWTPSNWQMCPRDQDARSLQFVAYGANRSQVALTSKREPFGDAVRTLMASDSGLADCQEWLVQLDYSAKLAPQSRQGELIRQVRTLLVGEPDVHEGVLPGVRGMDFEGGRGVFPQPFVKFKTQYGWVPLRKLGYGYQTMIAWVVDFVSRMVERYPDSENPLAEPAVCLVDEIDLHLHPVWQRKVIGYLSERFPNTQFIVTAHSPLVVQAAASADANIAVLVRSEEKDADGNHYVEIRNNPEDVRNWRLDQILTSDLFGGIELRSAETEKLFARKRELLAKPRRTKAEEADLARIQAEIDALPVGDSEKFARELDLLRRAAEELKSSRKP